VSALVDKTLEKYSSIAAQIFLRPDKKYLAAARLVRAARLLENPGYSITHVAFLLEYSSPQSFSRHVHGILDIGAAAFRHRFNGERMLEHMRAHQQGRVSRRGLRRRVAGAPAGQGPQA